MELNIVLFTVTPDDIDTRRAVSVDTLIDSYSVDTDAVAWTEDGCDHLQRDHAVLTARYGDSYLIALGETYLLTDLLLHPAVDITHEVVGT
jgi:hypothetical protein